MLDRGAVGLDVTLVRGARRDHEVIVRQRARGDADLRAPRRMWSCRTAASVPIDVAVLHVVGVRDVRRVEEAVELLARHISGARSGVRHVLLRVEQGHVQLGDLIEAVRRHRAAPARARHHPLARLAARRVHRPRHRRRRAVARDLGAKPLEGRRQPIAHLRGGQARARRAARAPPAPSATAATLEDRPLPAPPTARARPRRGWPGTSPPLATASRRSNSSFDASTAASSSGAPFSSCSIFRRPLKRAGSRSASSRESLSASFRAARAGSRTRRRPPRRPRSRVVARPRRRRRRRRPGRRAARRRGRRRWAWGAAGSPIAAAPRTSFSCAFITTVRRGRPARGSRKENLPPLSRSTTFCCRPRPPRSRPPRRAARAPTPRRRRADEGGPASRSSAAVPSRSAAASASASVASTTGTRLSSPAPLGAAAAAPLDGAAAGSVRAASARRIWATSHPAGKTAASAAAFAGAASSLPSMPARARTVRLDRHRLGRPRPRGAPRGCATTTAPGVLPIVPARRQISLAAVPSGPWPPTASAGPGLAAYR